MTTIAVQVISEEYGENKCLELLELIKTNPHLYHVGFRRFNDGTNCLMLVLTEKKLERGPDSALNETKLRTN